MSTFSQFAGGGIKSIQRGLAVIPVNIGSVFVTVAAVNMSKASLNILGWGVTSTNTMRIGDTPWGQLSSATSIDFRTGSINSAGAVTIPWELVEYY